VHCFRKPPSRASFLTALMGPMARPRTATAVLEASGAFINHPNRQRPHEPNSGRGIGPAPGHLTEAEGQAWDEIVSNCAAGVFQSSDRPVVEALAVEMSAWRENRAKFGTKRLALMVSLLARCGMTPSDRSKVIVVARSEDEKPKVGLARFR
jgi:phage terminase small subunit